MVIFKTFVAEYGPNSFEPDKKKTLKKMDAIIGDLDKISVVSSYDDIKLQTEGYGFIQSVCPDELIQACFSTILKRKPVSIDIKWKES